MNLHIFAPKKGIKAVQVGADPRVEITASKPLRTSDPHLIRELLENPFLQVRKLAVAAETKVKAARKAKSAKTPAAPTAAASDGGAS
jgi:hypothetical protein